MACTLLTSPPVNAAAIALFVGTAVAAAAPLADAQTDRPVFVTVVGHDAIRFRLSAGATAPCDSPDNRMLYDGWLRPGRFAFGTGADVVCYQHTSGALREVNWSVPRVVTTLMGTKARRRPTEIEVSTD
jgi:hypothetical protein